VFAALATSLQGNRAVLFVCSSFACCIESSLSCQLRCIFAIMLSCYLPSIGSLLAASQQQDTAARSQQQDSAARSYQRSKVCFSAASLINDLKFASQDRQCPRGARRCAAVLDPCAPHDRPKQCYQPGISTQVPNVSTPRGTTSEYLHSSHVSAVLLAATDHVQFPTVSRYNLPCVCVCVRVYVCKCKRTNMWHRVTSHM
jgi:hypothetical protein